MPTCALAPRIRTKILEQNTIGAWNVLEAMRANNVPAGTRWWRFSEPCESDVGRTYTLMGAHDI